MGMPMFNLVMMICFARFKIMLMLLFMLMMMSFQGKLMGNLVKYLQNRCMKRRN